MSDKNLKPTVGKYVRVSLECDSLFQNLRRTTGKTDGELVEIMVAQFALSLQEDVTEAQQYLFSLIVKNVQPSTPEELQKILARYRNPRGRPKKSNPLDNPPWIGIF